MQMVKTKPRCLKTRETRTPEMSIRERKILRTNKIRLFSDGLRLKYFT